MIAETNESCAAQSESAGFKSTHWTVVLETARQDSASGQAALGSLYETYWAPIYAFVRRSGQTPHAAEDLAQDFFARLVEMNWLASITREGGKFRSWLLTALKPACQFYREGIIAADQRRAILHEAAQSECGRSSPGQQAARVHLLPLTLEECLRGGLRVVVSCDPVGSCTIETSTDLVHWTL